MRKKKEEEERAAELERIRLEKEKNVRIERLKVEGANRYRLFADSILARVNLNVYASKLKNTAALAAASAAQSLSFKVTSALK